MDKIDDRGRVHRWEDRFGVMHVCEESGQGPGSFSNLVWTKCGKDVPANQSFKTLEAATCKQCLTALRGDRHE